MKPPRSVAQALADASRHLKQAGIADPARDARILMAHALNVERSRLTLMQPEPMPPDAQARLDSMLAARSAHQPVAQITGERAFFGHRFCVTPAVLDPRPETETLVATALEGAFRTVLDLGTGSGCILLSLLSERHAASGIGSDLSESALEVARRNAERLGIGRAEFIQSDWFSNIKGRFDLIVSNPPYIAQAEMPALAKDVFEWEPHMALTPGPDGLKAYREIVAKAVSFLHRGGRLLVETGPRQAIRVSGLFRGAGFDDVRIVKDLDGRDRVVQGRLM